MVSSEGWSAAGLCLSMDGVFRLVNTMVKERRECL